MSNVLKRMQQVQKKKSEAVPNGVAQDVTEMYLADLKKKEYDKANLELREELVEAANAAELEGALLRIKSMESEHNILKELLSKSQSESKQANDLVKSLKAEVKLNSISIKEMETNHRSGTESQKDIIRGLELAVIKAESKPAQMVQQKKDFTLPSFEFQPVRGENGRIKSVVAKPI